MTDTSISLFPHFQVISIKTPIVTKQTPHTCYNTIPRNVRFNISDRPNNNFVCQFSFFSVFSSISIQVVGRKRANRLILLDYVFLFVCGWAMASFGESTKTKIISLVTTEWPEHNMNICFYFYDSTKHSTAAGHRQLPKRFFNEGSSYM